MTRLGEKIIHPCETLLVTLIFLVFTRGDRREAALSAAESDKAVSDLLQARPGKIHRRDANSVWNPGAAALALRSWFWFVVAALLGVGMLLLLLSIPAGDPYLPVALSLIPAVPSALFVSRQLSHLLAQRALRTGMAGPRNLAWVGRWLSGGAVLVLALALWALWATILVL
ncbi:hypothetical protein [Streptomyces sp. NPDC008125]|uniref:hypothetical protein n=1 Tax=Streptomyces sp. NPDC008125 TaxID=3364811 RepID=UPI0036E95B51